MRVLAACSLGGAGHFQPLVPWLAAARARGHDVVVVGPPALRDMVRLAQFPFLAGGEPAEAEVAPIRERLPVAGPSEASVLGNRELFGRLATTAMLPEMERVFVRWRPDIVLREPCEYASAIVAARTGITTAQVAISLAEAESASITAAAPALEEHRRGLTDELRVSPYLTRFPPSLDPSPFPTTIRFRDNAGAPAAALPSWWQRADAPLVYVTFGTVLGHMSIAAGVYAVALDGVRTIDARVLLTVGRFFDPADLGQVPANVHVEQWVPQHDVLAEADVVVCHGGSGTAFGALAAGIPLVTVPLFADQFENGRRIAEYGAGVVVEANTRSAGGSRAVISREDAPRITAALDDVLTSPRYAARAHEVAAEMAAVPHVDTILDALLHELQRTAE